ncbi:acetamidase/formamidase family protein [Streptomyces sp. 6-11-2]|uniref:acetamidase/formamidase family protein n=1 Tax=Streptomyces sp. 6-11-2 TaxID=2585753 RepID=UPI0011451688|nr:acetamidase/formamidase family protein [Streptomyces sp. 6-11-2]GED89558.1 acetamidase [Streptomyces sp. 6-11-2]
MYHKLTATPETCQWGYFDNALEPALTIRSGDVVAMECLTHHAGEAPDLMMDDGVREVYENIDKNDRGPGPHIVTGPIAVVGAEPGDVLECRFLQAEPRLPYGVNFQANWGLLYGPVRAPLGHATTTDLESHQHVVVYEADWQQGTAKGLFQYAYPYADESPYPGTFIEPHTVARQSALRGVSVPLRPHMGTAGVAPAQSGRIHTVPPGEFGGNVDNRSFVPGTRMFYPVQVPSALFWAGDTHFAEGDGEISGTAIEGHLNVMLQFVLHKNLRIRTPLLETDTEVMVHGFHENLDEAVRIAAAETVYEMGRRWGLSQRESYSLLSVAGDLRVTQVVNGVKGAHFVLSKSVVREMR